MPRKVRRKSYSGKRKRPILRFLYLRECFNTSKNDKKHHNLRTNAGKLEFEEKKLKALMEFIEKLNTTRKTEDNLIIKQFPI